MRWAVVMTTSKMAAGWGRCIDLFGAVDVWVGVGVSVAHVTFKKCPCRMSLFLSNDHFPCRLLKVVPCVISI